ncbi:hypothetical protein D187_006679 [Cystobacter fuscus DSM 2262]|uniref:Uncharacterized protein n=1 Tax=Cystobacter fuscus (strain ATCC 25194 / DSM 2262 / NBRC 100088 / M29) TaxID=1242864 RepID=S9P1B8_CYSF2|nr:hypothetical protein D187_006679 [Cystobacter fuscus DSM 2262]
MRVVLLPLDERAIDETRNAPRLPVRPAPRGRRAGRLAPGIRAHLRAHPGPGGCLRGGRAAGGVRKEIPTGFRGGTPGEALPPFRPRRARRRLGPGGQ